MKKTIVFSLFIWCIGGFMMSTQSYGAIINVYVGDSIQDAINSATSGDTVMVGVGDYYENIIMKDGVNLIGNNAVIVGDGTNYYSSTVIGANATIRGFYIQNIDPYAKAIYIQDKNTIVDNNILEASVYSHGGNVNIINNIFTSTLSGGYIWQPLGQSVIRNNLVIEVDNGFSFSAADGRIIVENNTFVGVGDGLGIFLAYGEIVIRNNIISDFGLGFSAASNNLGLNTYNLLNNDTNYSSYISQGIGEIFGDPLFVAGPGPYGDYYLSQLIGGQLINSPAVDAGDPLSIPYGATSISGVTDIGRIDIGYHYQTEIVPEPSSLLLLSFGLLGTGFFKRRVRKNK